MEDSIRGQLIPYSHSDLLRIQDLLDKKEMSLTTQLDKVKYQLKQIKEILALNKDNDETFSVFIPKNFFEMKDPEYGIGTSRKFNWQEIALKIIKENDGLMITEMVFETARIMFMGELPGRQESIRNFSSALHYLNYKGKLHRYKEEGAKSYLYGLSSNFLLDGRPKDEALKRFKKLNN